MSAAPIGNLQMRRPWREKRRRNRRLIRLDRRHGPNLRSLPSLLARLSFKPNTTDSLLDGEPLAVPDAGLAVKPWESLHDRRNGYQ
jgi:hypothetical protein